MDEPQDGPNIEEESDPPAFLLSATELGVLKQFAVQVRERLRKADPSFIRTAAVALIAIERLPKITPGAAVTVGWQAFGSGLREWADVFISEHEIRATVGSTSYDPGPNTEYETDFSIYPGSDREGDLREWEERARLVAASGHLYLRDEWAGKDHIDWSPDEDH